MVRVDTPEVYDRLLENDPPPDGLQVSWLYHRTSSIIAPIQYDVSRSSACLLMWDMTIAERVAGGLIGGSMAKVWLPT